MTRKQARETLFTLLYERSYHKEAAPEVLLADAQQYSDWEADSYITDGFLGICEKEAEIDKQIQAHAHGWKINRISGVSIAILRLCVYEILFCEDIPDSVAMNEAVELAKKYDHEDAPGFINGIVNAVSKAKETV